MIRRILGFIESFFSYISPGWWMVIINWYFFGTFVPVLFNIIFVDYSSRTSLKVIFIITIVPLFIANLVGCITLVLREKRDKAKQDSFDDYGIYKDCFYTYDKNDYKSYEEYANASSLCKISSLFEESIRNGITVSIIDFLQDDSNINSLFALRLFESHIKANPDKYNNMELTLFGFAKDNCLSVFPIEYRKVQFKYRNESLTKMRKYDSEKFNEYNLIYTNMVDKFSKEKEFDSNYFNVGFGSMVDLNELSKIRNGRNPFMKVKCRLSIDKDYSWYSIVDCVFEEYSYQSYCYKLWETTREWGLF